MSVPHLQQLITVQMTGNRRIATQIRQMNQNFERLGRTTERISNQIQRSMARQRRATQRTAQQTRTGLTNIQSGLVQLSTWLLNVNVKINNVFANMKTRFTEAETAMTQLKITMGLSGKTAVDSSVDFQRFAEASSQIDLLARTTQFTKREVANAFTALVQSGRTVGEASKMISSTLQFATASGGMLNLTDSVDLATLTIGTLGGAVDEVDGNLNMLLKTSQKTKIGFTDLRQVLQSMRAAYTKFSEVGGVSREAELMATAAALRTLGLSAGNSGQVIDQFSRSMDTMYSTLNKVFMMENQPNRKGGRRPRFSYKRGALAELFGVGRLSVQELQKQLNTTETDLRKLQDRFLMSQIFEYDKTGTRGSRRSLSDFITRLLKGYSDVVKRKGEGPADALIKSAIGTAGASTLIKSIISLAKTAGKSIDEAAEHYIGLVKELQTNSKEMMKADEEAKQTIAYRTKVLDSAIAALSNTIFEQDIVAISALDTYKEMVSATDTLMRNNKGLTSSVGMLGRGMQLLTGIGTNVGFALVAAATFSVALTHSLQGATVAATGLGATLGAFSRMFLLPTLTVVGQLTLALGGLGLAVVALMRYFSEGQDVGTGFKILLDNIKFAAMSAGGMVNLMFSDKFGSKGTKELVRQYYEMSDALGELERKRDQIRSKPDLGLEDRARLLGLNREYNILSSRMSKMKAALGESGFVGLDALGARGYRDLAINISYLLGIFKELAGMLRTVGESALIPVIVSIDYSLSALKYTLALLAAPLKAIAILFGYASDQASATTAILKLIGFIVGTVVGLRTFVFFFRLMGSSISLVTNGFLGAAQGVRTYGSNLHFTLQAGNRQITGGNLLTRMLRRLSMAYGAVTRDNRAFTGALDVNYHAQQRNVLGLRALGSAAVGAGRRLYGVSRAFMGLGVVSTMAGSMLAMSGNDNLASWGNLVLVLGMVITALGTIGNFMIPLITASLVRMYAAGLGMFLPIIIVVTAISLLVYGIYKLVNYLLDTEPPSWASNTMGMPATSSYSTASAGPIQGQANFLEGASGKLVTTNYSGGNYTGGVGLTPVPTQTTTKTINHQPNQTNVRIDHAVFELRGGRPEDLKNTVRDLSKRISGGSVSFATDMG